MTGRPDKCDPLAVWSGTGVTQGPLSRLLPLGQARRWVHAVGDTGKRCASPRQGGLFGDFFGLHVARS
jgi:hypothetical protein